MTKINMLFNKSCFTGNMVNGKMVKTLDVILYYGDILLGWCKYFWYYVNINAVLVILKIWSI